jgi:hypothetical protein
MFLVTNRGNRMVTDSKNGLSQTHFTHRTRFSVRLALLAAEGHVVHNMLIAAHVPFLNSSIRF